MAAAAMRAWQITIGLLCMYAHAFPASLGGCTGTFSFIEQGIVALPLVASGHASDISQSRREGRPWIGPVHRNHKNRANGFGGNGVGCRKDLLVLRIRAARDSDEYDAHMANIIAARQRIVDELLVSVWAGRDGHCTPESEDAEIDGISGEL